jgi:hypothetical protein
MRRANVLNFLKVVHLGLNTTYKYLLLILGLKNLFVTTLTNTASFVLCQVSFTIPR